MSYRRIILPKDLPDEDAYIAEDLRFDMKMVHPKPAELVDLANDVASFANAVGGVILIGAHEHPRDSGKLHKYISMPYVEAQKLGPMLSKALQIYCSPIPIADARPILLKGRTDEYVVAVNCDPYGAPPIGVSYPGQQGTEKHWAFPTRRGDRTHNLRPEELATIMEPKLRRTTLALERIPPMKESGDPIRAHFIGSAQPIWTLDIQAIDREALVIQLVEKGTKRKLLLPLDAIEMIWQDSSTQMYRVAVAGKISLTPVNDALEFYPRSYAPL